MAWRMRRKARQSRSNRETYGRAVCETFPVLDDEIGSMSSAWEIAYNRVGDLVLDESISPCSI